jgi:hemerythrin-like domain-containing protein
MNALELLKKDHKEVKKLLEELEGEDAGREQRNIFNEIDQKLRLHEHLEETLLYPELKKHEESKEEAIEGFVEHHTANAVLLDLAKQKAGSPEFSARAKVLKELIEHHIEEEEGELFDKAEEVLGEERLEQIGDKMQELMDNPPANLPEPRLLGGTRKAA